MHLAALLQLYEKRYQIQISFEVCHPILYRLEPLLLNMKQYQHHSPFCLHHKSRDGSQSCADNKNRTIKMIRDGKCRGIICRYGIWEYVVPVMRGKLLLGALFFGTFTKPGTKVKLPAGVAMPPQITLETYKKLRYIAAFIRKYIDHEISCSDAEEILTERAHCEQFYLESCRSFIERHFQENIALADLAERLGVNPNYLGGLLRKLQKETFRAQLTRRRLAEAKEWLETRQDCSIMDIALSCGFQDSNYFSTVFRKAYGLSPSAYRDQKQKSYLIGLNIKNKTTYHSPNDP